MKTDWTKEQLKQLFNFAPEERTSEDPDILYLGELIDIEKGGINNEVAEQKNISEIALSPHSIAGNLFEIKKAKKT